MKIPRMTRHQVVIALMVFWALMFVRTVRAATLHEFMGDYDQMLLQWAAASAMLGGGIRTILSLESDKRAVRDIASTAMWDAAKSLVAGMAAFILIQSLRSGGMMIPSEIRFTAVLVAGWARMAAFEWMLDTGKEWLEARKTQIVSKPLDKQAEEKKDTP